MSKPLIILGSGGVGREIAATVKKHFQDTYAILGFVDDGKSQGEFINDYKVLGGINWLFQQKEELSIVIGIGNPFVRQKIITQLQEKTFNYPTIIHPSTEIDDIENCQIGKGCYISAMCVITTNISIGDFCFINSHCSLQHDTFVGSNCTLMPGVRITGGAKIGEGTYVSGNTLIADSIEISAFSKI